MAYGHSFPEQFSNKFFFLLYHIKLFCTLENLLAIGINGTKMQAIVLDTYIPGNFLNRTLSFFTS